MNRNFTTLFAAFFLFSGTALFFGKAMAQQLGIYEFTGHTCAAPLTAVTTQPANATFSNYTLAGAACTAAAGVYNANTWTVSPTLDPTKYFEFSITPNACTVMQLDSLKFLHRVSSSGGAVTVVIRSSLDGFTADIYNEVISGVNVNVNEAVELPAAFNYLTSGVTFRIYVVNILATGATYRHDNVALIGTATTYPLADYYQDSDGDGFGNLAVSVYTCTPPAGYVADNTDCNDNNNLIGGPVTYYADADNDGFGNPSVTQLACIQPVGYVANDDDCDDTDNMIGIATTVYYADADNDGFGNAAVTQTACSQPVGYVTNDDDCDDNNNLVGIATTVYYQDADNDGFGNGAVTQIACSAPPGYVANGDDCDDTNNAIHPGATETCDGIDNDCFGGIDDNVVTQTWYADTDNDGFGDPSVSMMDCAQPVGYVANDDDCDDTDNMIGVANTTFYADADNDGFGDNAVSLVACSAPPGYVTNDDDCDDNNNAIGAPLSYYPDSDNDGFGSAAAAAVVSCTPVANHVTNNTDCNDANANIYPGATEIPNNGIDEDCNGSDLNTIGTQIGLYEFNGQDCQNGVFALGVTAQPANATFSDYGTAGTNCANGVGYINANDWNGAATIDLTEYNGFTVTPANCYGLDLRRMTFLHRVSNSAGSPTVVVRSSLDNFTTNIWTKQFTATGVNVLDTVWLPAQFQSIQGPVTFRFYILNMAQSSATYRQDNVGVNGFINALTPQTYYADADGDGFGDPNTSVVDCTLPQGYVADNTDCNDNNAEENPNAVWYQDADSDGLGNSAVSITQCTQPAGYVVNSDDCNDNDNAIGAGITYYEDADNDGFGNAASVTVACTQPVGYVTIDGDCDDNDDQVTVPTDVFYRDADNDGFGDGTMDTVACSAPAGYVANDDDCDDSNNTITTGNTYYEDADGDGFGDAASTTQACSAPVGYVANNTDCDDTNDQIYPGAVDIANNSIDENCDGVDGYLAITELTESGLQVFPNPGNDQVSILLSGNWANAGEVVFFAADGKTVIATQSLVNGTTVTTAALETGTYLIRVTDGTRTAQVRWVKY